MSILSHHTGMQKPEGVFASPPAWSYTGQQTSKHVMWCSNDSLLPMGQVVLVVQAHAPAVCVAPPPAAAALWSPAAVHRNPACRALRL
eukprot:388049-Pelagomonas_calceolata.AAC.3